MSEIKNFIAETRIEPYRMVKKGSEEGTVKPTTSSTDEIIGVTTEVGSDAGQRIDVQISGLAKVETGSNDSINTGNFLTSGANGRARKAAPDAGNNCRVIGPAFESASASCCAIDVNIFIGQIQG